MLRNGRVMASFLVATTLLVAVSPAEEVRTRVTILGFHVGQWTSDHLLEVDGRGDEIQIIGEVTKKDAAGNKTPNAFQTCIFGDIEPGKLPQKKAGSKDPKFGGLMTGDAYPEPKPWNTKKKVDEEGLDLPLVAYEGTIGDGESVEIEPVILEIDGDPGPFPNVAAAIKQLGGFDLTAIVGKAGNRAVGTDGDGKYTPKRITLTPKSVKDLADTKVGGLPKGTMALQYQNAASPGERYTLYIKVELLERRK